ncbi:UNVERIFIED_CONTAM: hypothetical protein PYX00_000569 [Menopon gallinae]|uniref:Uncharacterized protein n=1 Tax=Menopon gallinae TaxID=328185 RepID=A0AAW2IAW6_9NEOP
MQCHKLLYVELGLVYLKIGLTIQRDYLSADSAVSGGEHVRVPPYRRFEADDERLQISILVLPGPSEVIQLQTGPEIHREI